MPVLSMTCSSEQQRSTQAGARTICISVVAAGVEHAVACKVTPGDMHITIVHEQKMMQRAGATSSWNGMQLSTGVLTLSIGAAKVEVACTHQ